MVTMESLRDFLGGGGCGHSLYALVSFLSYIFETFHNNFSRDARNKDRPAPTFYSIQYVFAEHLLGDLPNLFLHEYPNSLQFIPSPYVFKQTHTSGSQLSEQALSVWERESEQRRDLAPAQQNRQPTPAACVQSRHGVCLVPAPAQTQGRGDCRGVSSCSHVPGQAC